MLESPEDKEIKLLWMQEELSKWSEDTVDLLLSHIKRLKMNRTGDLSDSFNYKAFMENGNPGTRISFLKYGRYVDIAAYKSKTYVNTNMVVWGIKENRKKPKKWYAKNMYALLGRLQSRVMYCLTEEELARLKHIIEERKQTTIEL